MTENKLNSFEHYMADQGEVSGQTGWAIGDGVYRFISANTNLQKNGATGLFASSCMFMADRYIAPRFKDKNWQIAQWGISSEELLETKNDPTAVPLYGFKIKNPIKSFYMNDLAYNIGGVSVGLLGIDKLTEVMINSDFSSPYQTLFNVGMAALYGVSAYGFAQAGGLVGFIKEKLNITEKQKDKPTKNHRSNFAHAYHCDEKFSGLTKVTAENTVNAGLAWGVNPTVAVPLTIWAGASAMITYGRYCQLKRTDFFNNKYDVLNNPTNETPTVTLKP